MRAFDDETGRTWDVVVGRESWGALFAIFIPRADLAGGGHETPGDVRQTPLQAAGYDDANAELDALSEDDLRSLLQRSAPKDTA